jgi:LysM repeat protein
MTPVVQLKCTDVAGTNIINRKVVVTMFSNRIKPMKISASLSIVAIILAFGAFGITSPAYASGLNIPSNASTQSNANAAPLPGAHLETNSLNLFAPVEASNTPQTDTSSVTVRYYTAQPGDTLTEIVKKFDITLADLIASNPDLRSVSIVPTGEVLVIPPTQNIIYTVRSGDYLTKIAKEFQVSLQDLLAANPDLTNPSLIHPGEKLNIPSTIDVVYTIQSGDSMAKISRNFEVTLSDLINANPQVKDPSLIYPGQVLLIPSSHEVVYVVEAGNSLSGIATEYGVSVAELLKANPSITNPNLIRTGMELVIPTAVAGQYVVLPGDSLSQIAQNFHVSQQDLLRANPQIQNPDQIYVGEVLTIPVT